MSRYSMYKGFKSFKEISNQFNELMEQVKTVTTIELAKRAQASNLFEIVEINGDRIESFIQEGGTDNEIEWIRYENYKNLWYIYCNIKDGKVTDVAFDVGASCLDYEFIDSARTLSQQKYYEAIENIERDSVIGHDCFEIIGYDTEDLPDVTY